jgi:hypothetical protein
MNGISVILLVLAIHAGSVDVDTAREADLQWFQNSRLEGTWTMSPRSDGVYRFSGATGELNVQRMEEPDLSYAVSGTAPEGDREFIAALTLPPGFLHGSVPREDILLAFATGDDDDDDDDADSSDDSGETTFTVQERRNLITVTYPAAEEVLTLRF